MSYGRGPRRARFVLLLSSFAFAGLALCGPVVARADSPGNIPCPEGTTQYKVEGNVLQGLDPGESASFTVDGQTFTFTAVDFNTFDWSATIAVSVIYVKGGPDHTTTTYDPPVTSGTNLSPPSNPGGQPPTISGVYFCAPKSQSTTTTCPLTTTTWAPTTTTSAPTTTTSTTSTSTSTTSTSTSTTSASTSTTTSTTVPQSTTVVTEGTTATTAPPTTTTATTEPTTTTVESEGTTVVAPTTSTSVAAPTSSVAAENAQNGSLPFTGGKTFPLLWLAAGSIAAGALLLGRKRVER